MCHLCEDYEWKYLGIIFYSIKVWGDQPYALQEHAAPYESRSNYPNGTQDIFNYFKSSKYY